MMRIALWSLLCMLVLAPFSSALIVQEVRTPALTPGKESALIITLKNTLEDDIEDVSFGFILDETSFIAVGGSEESTGEIDEGDEEDFSFRIKPSYTVQPGDYELPYELSYTRQGDRVIKEGFIGVHVAGNPELRVRVEESTPVIGRSGELIVTIVNDGLADARFVSISVDGDGISLLSDTEAYIGTVDSDDFETARFEVLYQEKRATLDVTLSYRDLENQRISEQISLPIHAYTELEAQEQGIITPSRTPLYIGVLVVLIFLWFAWRWFKKRRRKRSTLQN